MNPIKFREAGGKDCLFTLINTGEEEAEMAAVAGANVETQPLAFWSVHNVGLRTSLYNPSSFPPRLLAHRIKSCLVFHFSKDQDLPISHPQSHY